jgi:hypothetical protein
MEPNVAGTKRPSFLKRQKEQQRMARAAEKRETRRLKKRSGAARMEESGEPELETNELEGTEEADPKGANGQS